MKNKNMIYLPLKGRIGNQLFQYAFARYLQLKSFKNHMIVIDDSDVLKVNWVNSLEYYNLPNVCYTHNRFKLGFVKRIILFIYNILTYNKDYLFKYHIEVAIQKVINFFGVYICENGYIKENINFNNSMIYIDGYFQSEKFFIEIKDDIIKQFSIDNYSEIDASYINKFLNNNVVCISIKVEHNIGSDLYDVCSISYWKKAIELITQKVENPVFFICSDNVEYVLNNIIDVKKYNYFVQDKNLPVHISLYIMSLCSHFIIGNTTYGWWAQYLSKNPNKIVIAPSKWMKIDMPIDIYDDKWITIEV